MIYLSINLKPKKIKLTIIINSFKRKAINLNKKIQKADKSLLVFNKYIFKKEN